MYRIGKTFRFETSHNLPNHEGPCRNDHGHSYRVEIEVEGMDLMKGDVSGEGMLIDYKAIKDVVAPVIEKLDHAGPLQDRMQEMYATLPGKSFLGQATSTAESLAYLIYYLVRTKIPGNVFLHRVRVMETDSTWADYIHDNCPLGRVSQ